MGNSDDSAYFGLYIQHGGKFYTLDGSNHYVGGVMVPRHNCRTDKFTYKDIEEEVDRLGYVSWKAIIYKVPNSFDYKVIENDDDAREMVSYINDRCAVLHLFVDDGKLVGTGEVDEVSEDNQCNWDEDEWQGDISEVDKEGNHEARDNLLREDATNYCDEAYSVVKYRDTYKYGLPPLNGELLWPRAEGFPVVPPEAKKMPGRPKKKRKRDANEGKSTADGSTKAKRYRLQMTCGLCKQVGHNKRNCKNAPVQTAPKPRGKPGRPRKSEAQQTIMNVTGSSAASVSTSVGAATGSTSMGEAGRIFTHMPNERRTIFIPPRPTTTGSTRKNGKKRHIYTQESQV